MGIEVAGLRGPFEFSGVPSDGASEVQAITSSAAVTQGAWVLAYEGYRTVSMVFNVAAAVMEAALCALPTIGTGGCTVVLGGGVYTVTFAANLAKLALPLMTVPTNSCKDAGNADVTWTVAEGVAGVTASLRGAAKGAVAIDTTNGDIYQNTGTALVPVWANKAIAGLTSAPTELNLLDGSVAGTSVASKALVLGANKNTDVLALPVSGLKVGAGAGTAVTSSAAELNILTGVTATAAEINKVAAAGLASDGLARMGVARFTYDPSANAGVRPIAAHDLGVTLPAYAVVIGGFFDVNTLFTSAGGNAGTVAISVEGAGDIQAAVAVSGAPYSSIGRKAIVPKADSPESTSVKATAARAITATVAVQALTAGKLTGFLLYVVSVASA